MKKLLCFLTLVSLFPLSVFAQGMTPAMERNQQQWAEQQMMEDIMKQEQGANEGREDIVQPTTTPKKPTNSHVSKKKQRASASNKSGYSVINDSKDCSIENTVNFARYETKSYIVYICSEEVEKDLHQYYYLGFSKKGNNSIFLPVAMLNSMGYWEAVNEEGNNIYSYSIYNPCGPDLFVKCSDGASQPKYKLVVYKNDKLLIDEDVIDYHPASKL